MPSIRVVLPWSMWAIIAMFLSFDESCIYLLFPSSAD
jgi:hypothetical protein